MLTETRTEACFILHMYFMAWLLVYVQKHRTITTQRSDTHRSPQIGLPPPAKVLCRFHRSYGRRHMFKSITISQGGGISLRSRLCRSHRGALVCYPKGLRLRPDYCQKCQPGWTTSKSTTKKMLLLWTCSGITFCLAILGVYCDPRLPLHTWYLHQLWPYRKKENTFYFSQNNNNTNAHFGNLTDGFLLKNYSSDVTRVLQNNLQTHDMLWPQNKADHSEESMLLTPAILLSIVLFLYNVGLGSVPYVLISELFSINVRSLASSLLISWMWLSSFLVLRYYGGIAVSLGLHSIYYICASSTLLGSLYILFIIPETKGKSQEQIDEDLDGPLIVLGRRRRNENRR